jgi:hypothetical protein
MLHSRVYNNFWLILGRMDRIQFRCWHRRNWYGNNRKEVVEHLRPWRRVYAGRISVMVPEPRILLSLLLFLAWAGKWTALFLSSTCLPPNQPTTVKKNALRISRLRWATTRFLPTIPSDCCDPSCVYKWNLQSGVDTRSNLGCSIFERENC